MLVHGKAWHFQKGESRHFVLEIYKDGYSLLPPALQPELFNVQVEWSWLVLCFMPGCCKIRQIKNLGQAGKGRNEESKAQIYEGTAHCTKCRKVLILQYCDLLFSSGMSNRLLYCEYFWQWKVFGRSNGEVGKCGSLVLLLFPSVWYNMAVSTWLCLRTPPSEPSQICL